MLAAPSGSTPTMRVAGQSLEPHRLRRSVPRRRPERPRRRGPVGVAGHADRDRALPGDGAVVVEGVHVGRAVLDGGHRRGGRGLVVGAPAMVTSRVTAELGRSGRASAAAWCWAGRCGPRTPSRAQLRATPCAWLPALAQTTPRASSRAQRRHQVVGAAHLVGPAELQVLALEEHVGAEALREPGRPLDRGAHGDRGRRGAGDVVGRHGHASDPRTSASGLLEPPTRTG